MYQKTLTSTHFCLPLYTHRSRSVVSNSLPPPIEFCRIWFPSIFKYRSLAVYLFIDLYPSLGQMVVYIRCKIFSFLLFLKQQIYPKGQIKQHINVNVNCVAVHCTFTVYLTSPLLMDKMGQSFTMTNYCNEDLCEYVFIFLDGIIVINVQNRDCWVKECMHLYFCQLSLNWVCNFTFLLVASESVSLLAQQCYILSNF